MKKYKVIALSALIAAGFTSCDLTEKPTSYYEKDTYFETMDQAKMSVVGIYDCLAIDKHYGQYEMRGGNVPEPLTPLNWNLLRNLSSAQYRQWKN